MGNVIEVGGNSFVPIPQTGSDNQVLTNVNGQVAIWEDLSKEYTRINITNADSPITLTNINRSIYAVDLTNGSAVINLPEVISETIGQECFIYIERITEGNTLTINTFGTQTIRGETSKVFSVRYDGFHIVQHDYGVMHWDVIGWLIDSRTDEIKYIAGNENVSSVETLQDLLNNTLSSGIISSNFSVSNNDPVDAGIVVSSCDVMLRSDATDYSDTRIYHLNSDTFTISDGRYYLVINYNNGTPIYQVLSSGLTINARDILLVAILTKFPSNNEIQVLYVGDNLRNFPTRYAGRETLTNWLAYGSGLKISASNLNFSLTSGFLFNGVQIYSISALNSATNSFTYWWYNGTSWQTITSQTAINNTQYSNQTGTLQTLANNKYKTDFIYVNVNNPSSLHVILSQTEYSDLASAQAAGIPTLLPEFMQIAGSARIVGRAIVQKNAATMLVDSPFETIFASATPTLHNNLSGLNVGDFQHLTAAEKTLFDGFDARITALENP